MLKLFSSYYGENLMRPVYEIKPPPVLLPTNVEGIYCDFNGGARVRIDKTKLPEFKEIDVVFKDINTEVPIKYEVVKPDSKECIVSTLYWYYPNCSISVSINGKKVVQHKFNLDNKKIHIEAANFLAFGDKVCIMAHILEFSRLHPTCEIYVTMCDDITNIFEKNFPNIHFIKTKSILPTQGRVVNVWKKLPPDIYATFYISFDICSSSRLQKSDIRLIGLPRMVSDVLGVSPQNIFTPSLQMSKKPSSKNLIKDPYICVSFRGSQKAKEWHYPNGWSAVVQYLKLQGFRVICIDKQDISDWAFYEDVIKEGCEQVAKDLSLQQRIDIIKNCQFFIGLSSGLSWLAWACGKPVVMISGLTAPYNEFYTPYRVYNPLGCNACLNNPHIPTELYNSKECVFHEGTDRQWECSKNITSDMVIDKINQVLSDMRR